jgi:FO synthase subunit 2
MQETADSMLARQKEAIILGLEDILTKRAEAKKAGVVEVCMEGGYTDIDMEFYLEIVEARLIPSQVPQLRFFPRELEN